MSQPVRHADHPTQEDGKTHDVATRGRGQQVTEIRAGRAGRFGELDARGDHRAVRFGLHLAQAGQQREHGPVLGEDLGGEVLDPGLQCALAQPREKGGAEPAALPGIDHGHPDIRGVGLVRQPDEPALPHDLRRQQRQGDQRLVVSVIDLDRRLEGGLGQLGHDREEPPVAGLLAQARVRPDQGWRVIRAYLPDPDDVTGAERDTLRPARRGHGQPLSTPCAAGINPKHYRKTLAQAGRRYAAN
jgi:hypothetical protein